MITRTDQHIVDAYLKLTNRFNGGADRAWTRQQAARALGFTIDELETLANSVYPKLFPGKRLANREGK